MPDSNKFEENIMKMFSHWLSLNLNCHSEQINNFFLEATSPMSTLLNIETANEMFRSRGVPIKRWAELRGFKVALTYAVLEGRSKCACW